MKTILRNIRNRKSSAIFLTLSLLLATAVVSCSKDDDSGSDDDGSGLIGQPGNPRFNLQFSNSENVDLDLYVKTPGGNVIYYGNPSADGGTLDVDCICCAEGAENIFWQDGTAPSGTFEYWVDYYDSCTGSSPSSNYTLRVVRNQEVIATQTGSLSSGQSSVFTHNQN